MKERRFSFKKNNEWLKTNFTLKEINVGHIKLYITWQT